MTSIIFKPECVSAINDDLSAHPKLSEYRVFTQDDLEEWAEKEKISTEAINKQYGSFFTLNGLEFDPYFDRTSPTDMAELLNFCVEHVEKIETFLNGRTWYERAERKGYDESRWGCLEQFAEERFAPQPNPEANQVDYPASGVFIFNNTQSPGKRVHLLFGLVMDNYPVFLRRQDYLWKCDNDDYINDAGEKFLLVPLMPAGPDSHDVAWRAYCTVQQYVEISFEAFAGIVYSLDLTEIAAERAYGEPGRIFNNDTLAAYATQFQQRILPRVNTASIPVSSLSLNRLSLRGLVKKLQRVKGFTELHTLALAIRCAVDVLGDDQRQACFDGRCLDIKALFKTLTGEHQCLN